MDEETEVELREGMPVSNEDGEPLGTLGSLLVADEEEDAEFLTVVLEGKERLVPFEAVLGVGDGALVLDVPAAAMGKFPALRPQAEPTEAECEMAYRVFDEHASDYGGEEEDEG